MNTRGWTVMTVVAGLQLCGVAALAQNGEAVAAGKSVFQLRCAPCHGADRGGDPSRGMLPGTDALRIKYQGKLPALLEQRTDLTAPALKVFVRRGTWSMPPFRKTEISDADIDNIAAYLTVTSRGAGR
jgi:mono/diheme cytochrome c family protein